ncbi:MAG: PAS domain S-box protein [Gemmatimonadaceae bacterium]|nr:PAS domain S-box protein [Gemmatimonadaceae bacterium]
MPGSLLGPAVARRLNLAGLAVLLILIGAAVGGLLSLDVGEVRLAGAAADHLRAALDANAARLRLEGIANRVQTSVPWHEPPEVIEGELALLAERVDSLLASRLMSSDVIDRADDRLRRDWALFRRETEELSLGKASALAGLKRVRPQLVLTLQQLQSAHRRAQEDLAVRQVARHAVVTRWLVGTLLALLAGALFYGWWTLRAMRTLRMQRTAGQRALADREALLTALTTTAPAGLFRTDKEGKFLYANERFYGRTGLSESEALGDGWRRIIHPDNLARVEGEIERGLESGQPFQFRMRARGPGDGVARWVDVLLAPWLDEQGALVGWVGSSYDTTEHVEIERTLRALIVTSGTPDLDTYLRSCVRRVAEALGVEMVQVARAEDGADGAVRTIVSWRDGAFGETAGDCACGMLLAEASREPDGIRLVQSGAREGRGDGPLVADGIEAYASIVLRSGEGQLWGMLCVQSRQPLRGKGDFIADILRIVADRIERQLAVLAMRDSEARLRRVVDHIGDGLVTWDVDGRVTFFNDQALRIMGYERGSQIPGAIEDFVPPGQRAAAVARRRRRVQGQPVPDRLELQALRADGTPVWLDVGVVPITDQNGTVSGTQAIIRDITERKAAESRIAEALAVLDASPDAAYIIDPATMRFLYVNQGATRTLGFSRAELLEMTVLDIGENRSGHGFRAAIAPLADAKADLVTLETRHRRKDGDFIPVEVTVRLVTLEHGVRRIVALARDISERVARQLAERRAQRLEVIGSMAGGIAHDLNNALTPVAMGLELLRERNPAQAALVDQVASGVDRAAAMLRRLLGFARGVEGEFVPVNPQSLVLEVRHFLVSVLPKEIALEIRCDPDAPSVEGNPTQLHQVLLNLVVNARDAMPRGGTLSIQAAGVDLDAATASTLAGALPGRYLRFTVRDTGCGIPEESIEKIFDPFFTTKGTEGGTGLGLSTALHIAAAHKGFIHVESVVGEYTQVEVYVPASSAFLRHAGGAQRNSAPAFRGSGETVLFVDDERMVRRLAEVVLKRTGFKPLIAEDGADAMRKLREHGSLIRAVVTDLHMPGMTGVELARALREAYPHLPVAVASGRLDSEQAAALDGIGVTARMDKPFTERQLSDVLARMLGN